MTDYKRDDFTSVGTDINEVKRKNAESGLSYNEVKAMLAKTNGQGTAMYSDTDPEEVKMKNKMNM